MAKKYKIKNEDPSINFRLPEELKVGIYKRASLENKTVSNFLRDHLTEFMDGSLYATEIAYLENHSFVNSTEFLQLVIWMFSKRFDKKCKSSNEKLSQYIQTIKNINGNLPDDLIIEFDKVLVDLIKVRKDSGSYRTFDFTEKYYSGDNFNYELLENYLLNAIKPYSIT